MARFAPWVCAIGLLWPSLALAEEATTDDEVSSLTPPPINTPYLQYGVSFTGELVTSAGPMCSTAGVPGGPPCILGSGGGVAVRVGRRAAGPWYIGGAYELSKQDPSNLYRLATLQQVRGELRYYIPTGWVTTPYASAGLGLAGYGNEGGIDTAGPLAFGAFGAEVQLSRRTVAGIALAYRTIYFWPFEDPTRLFRRDAGVAQMIGLDLILEARDPL
jgi:hypothetical protein